MLRARELVRAPLPAAPDKALDLVKEVRISLVTLLRAIEADLNELEHYRTRGRPPKNRRCPDWPPPGEQAYLELRILLPSLHPSIEGDQDVDRLVSPAQMVEDLTVKLNMAYQVVFDAIFSRTVLNVPGIVRRLGGTEKPLAAMLDRFAELLYRAFRFDATTIVEERAGEWYYGDFLTHERHIRRQPPWGGSTADAAREAAAARKAVLAGPRIPVARFFDISSEPTPEPKRAYDLLVARLRQIRLVRSVSATLRLMRTVGLRPQGFHPGSDALIEDYLISLYDYWRRHQASSEMAYHHVLRFLRDYLQAFTIPARHNVLDTGAYGSATKNYLTTSYPRALSGQYVHDCGVSAIRVVRLLMQFTWYVSASPLQLRYFRMPLHVGVLVLRPGNDFEALPLAIVHNDQLWIFPKGRAASLLDTWRKADSGAHCSADGPEAFWGEIAAVYYFRWLGIHLPYRLYAVPSWRANLEARIWDHFQKQLVRGPGPFHAGLSGRLRDLHAFYLTYIGGTAAFRELWQRPQELLKLQRAMPTESECESNVAEPLCHLRLGTSVYACLTVCYHRHFIEGVVGKDATVRRDCQSESGVLRECYANASSGSALSGGALTACENHNFLKGWTVDGFNQDYQASKGQMLTSGTREICLARASNLVSPDSVVDRYHLYRSATRRVQRGESPNPCRELDSMPGSSE